MNYKKRNIIGIASFVVIILVMLNFNFFLEILNYKILGIKFIGIKGDELFLSELSEIELTKSELVEYITDNLNQIGSKKLQNFDFSIYVRNIEEEDKFLEKLRIPIDDNFDENLYQSLDLIPKNEELLFRFVLYSKDKSYMSKIFSIKLVDELYKNEGKIILELNEFSNVGIVSSVSVPKYLNLEENSKINVTAKYNELAITGLSARYDVKNNNIVVSNLVPLKEYSYVEFTTRNSDSIVIILNIRNFLMQSENELQDYLSKIYLNSLNRYPYESEYVESLNKLSNHEISINEFLSGIILSEEFDNVNNTPKQIVDSIYFLVNKQRINGRLSTLMLDEFNHALLDKNTRNNAKLEMLNDFLSDEESLNYMETKLNVRVE